MSDVSDTDDLEEVREKKLEELRAKAEGETGAEDAPVRAADEPIHLTDRTQFDQLTAEEGVVLVDFYADWCGPCQMLEPIVENLAETTPATVLKVDVDAHQQLAGEFGVRGVPTLLLFESGDVVERIVGVQDEQRLASLIEQHTA